MLIAKKDKFRVRGPSYQRWTSTESATPKAWDDMLNGLLGLNKVVPENVAGFRIQVNFKREKQEKKSNESPVGNVQLS